MGRIQAGTFLIMTWLFCLVIDNGSAIKCWDCRSDKEPECGDPFNHSIYPLYDCTMLPGAANGQPQPNRCKIVKQDDGTIIRSCTMPSEINVPTNCTKVKNDKGVFIETCYCDADRCNSFAVGSKSAGISTVPFVGVVTFLLFAVMTCTIQ